MGKHSIPKGEYSSYGRPNGSPRHDNSHQGKHRAGEATGSSGQNQTTSSDAPRSDK